MGIQAARARTVMTTDNPEGDVRGVRLQPEQADATDNTDIYVLHEIGSRIAAAAVLPATFTTSRGVENGGA